VNEEGEGQQRQLVPLLNLGNVGVVSSSGCLYYEIFLYGEDKYSLVE
jgi:hypothetical protein